MTIDSEQNPEKQAPAEVPSEAIVEDEKPRRRGRPKKVVSEETATTKTKASDTVKAEKSAVEPLPSDQKTVSDDTKGTSPIDKPDASSSKEASPRFVPKVFYEQDSSESEKSSSEKTGELPM